MNMQNEEMIILRDESGAETRYSFLDDVEYNGEEYAVLLPWEHLNAPSTEVVILKIETDAEDTDSEVYVGVENEEDLQAVFRIFKRRFRDEFHFLT